jgi:hypothetical protein
MHVRLGQGGQGKTSKVPGDALLPYLSFQRTYICVVVGVQSLSYVSWKDLCLVGHVDRRFIQGNEV